MDVNMNTEDLYEFNKFTNPKEKALNDYTLTVYNK